jgi:VanZ family protein
MIDPLLGKEIDVPFPKDPAGGYTHDRHKENYILMFNSGLLYQLTGDARYATLVRNLLLKYAKLNPTLKKHPQATSSSPGHIFWQALNDANWLVYAGLGYDLVYNSSLRRTQNN